MTKFSSRTALLLVAALLAPAAAAQTDTRGVRILLPTEAPPPPAPAPEVIPVPAPTLAPVPSSPEPAKRPTMGAELISPAQREASRARTEIPRVAPTPAPLACIRAFARADMLLAAGSGSRKKLRDLLQSKPQRLVLDVAPFAPAAIPEAISPWFAEVRPSGGTVSETEIKCTRSFSLAKLFSGLFGRRDPSQDYLAIRGYDAILWIDGQQKLVRQVELRRREQQD